MLLINNKWLETQRSQCVVSPVDGKNIGKVSVAGTDEIRAAVEAARKALATPLSSYKRSQFLKAACIALEKNREEITRLMVMETGKVVRDCRCELDRALFTFTLSAQEALRFSGEVLPCDVTDLEYEKQAIVVPVPLGVVAAITPFNFPLNIPAHKIGPALAAGNSVILKPSPYTPLTANRLGELFIEAGWPAGWLNILHGGSEVARALAAADIDALNLTGGRTAGEDLSRHGAGKRLLLELGGNDAAIIEPDADIDVAVPIIVQQSYGSSGQRCTSCNRLFVHESLFAQILERLQMAISQLVVGDPLSDNTDIGPLISEQAAIRTENKVSDYVSVGAKIHAGGQRKGSYYWPTLVSGLDPLYPPVLEETFGPVLTAYPYEKLEQVTDWINASRYGLQAGVFTKDLEKVKRLFQQLQVGTLVVNHGPNFRIESLPFGGAKDSGCGREGVIYAMRELSTLKTLVF